MSIGGTREVRERSGIFICNSMLFLVYQNAWKNHLLVDSGYMDEYVIITLAYNPDEETPLYVDQVPLHFSSIWLIDFLNTSSLQMGFLALLLYAHTGNSMWYKVRILLYYNNPSKNPGGDREQRKRTTKQRDFSNYSMM